MLNISIEKNTILLDRSFLLAYWFPVFIATSLALFIRALAYGWMPSVVWWQQDWMVNGQKGGLYIQLWILAGALIFVTMLAYLIQPFARTMIRFYEGHWPNNPRKWFEDLPYLGEKSIWHKKSKDRNFAEQLGDLQRYNQNQKYLFYNFPSNANRLMPTRLGNVLRAAEDYSSCAYGMDSIFWWPRLWPLLPESVRTEIEISQTTMIALLNFSWLIVIVALFGSSHMAYENLYWESLLVLFLGSILSMTLYRAAVAQAQNYGEQIRSIIDLYRFDLVKALHQALPMTLEDEIALWDMLMLWLYNNDRYMAKNMRYYWQPLNS